MLSKRTQEKMVIAMAILSAILWTVTFILTPNGDEVFPQPHKTQSTSIAAGLFSHPTAQDEAKMRLQGKSR